MVFLMKYARGWAMVLLLACAPAVLSQFIVLPSPLAGAGYSGFGVGLSKHGRHSQLSAYFTGGSGYYSSYYGYPYYPVGVNRVTVVQVVTPPRMVVVPPAGAEAERGPARPRPEVVEPPDEKPMPGNGGFQPVRPPMPPPIPRRRRSPPRRSRRNRRLRRSRRSRRRRRSRRARHGRRPIRRRERPPARVRSGRLRRR